MYKKAGHFSAAGQFPKGRSEEMVNGLYGPGLMDQAEAIAAAIVSAVNKLIAKPPAPSITS
ncbi:hypothetical protein X739_28070 [Mesorhizobium sp. LNHC220B00]|nr:hypothetical protein [Mesorhizobium sp. LNHC220B00]ESY81065.1 hypothetical protein X739_28070 [Mesorhizobium sp. LNHC220B00]